MKKFTKLFAVLAVAGLAFTSCDDATEDLITPTITKQGDIEEVDGNFVGTFKIVCADDAALDEVTANYAFGTETKEIAKSNIDINDGKKYEWFATITFPIEVEGERVTKITIEASVKGNRGGKSSKFFETPKGEDPDPEKTDLETAVDFSFKRVGGGAATGLDVYGLAWPSQTRATMVNLEKGTASKFVELNSSDWKNITTKEDLKEAIDNADEIDGRFRKISAEKDETHDIVLGTINGGTYYMLHITSSTVKSETAGSTIEIKGQSRK